MCISNCIWSIQYIDNSMNETGLTKSLSLTSASRVHSNVYGLCDIHYIRYHTTVDSSHSTSPPVQIYHHLTSSSVEVPGDTTARNSSSIGEEPVPYDSWPNGIRRSATSSLVSYTNQGITTFTNVLQGHKTVVLVGCTFEGESDFCARGNDIQMLSNLSSISKSRKPYNKPVRNNSSKRQTATRSNHNPHPSKQIS